MYPPDADKGPATVCRNCDGNCDDYYGEGYPCDQCKNGWQYYHQFDLKHDNHEHNYEVHGQMDKKIFFKCQTCGKMKEELINAGN